MQTLSNEHAAGVADHFAVVGFDDNGFTSEEILEIINSEEIKIEPESISNLLSIKLDPKVLQQYPIIDQHSGQKFPEGVEYFCFPHGLKLFEKASPPTFHSFVHTSEDGTRMIGCTLNFSEELTKPQYQSLQSLMTTSGLKTEIDDRRFFTRKGICLLSRYGFINSFRTFLLALYKMAKEVGNKNIIPIERYVCNFVDDIPVPPPGRVDIKYFIGEDTITFACPPLNEPNTWFGYSIFPLFECLSAENVIYLLTLLLTERQILFISSQYHLLTLCAEIITSLLYPLRWAHAYIPVLPTKLLGALGAPFPFIFGIHHETYKNNASLIANETVKVFLDDNVIAFGSLGLPPPIPEGRYKKLYYHIIENIPWFRSMMDHATTATTATLTASATHYQHHHSDSQVFQSEYWKKFRLPYFDDANSRVSMEPMSSDVFNITTATRMNVLPSSVNTTPRPRNYSLEDNNTNHNLKTTATPRSPSRFFSQDWSNRDGVNESNEDCASVKSNYSASTSSIHETGHVVSSSSYEVNDNMIRAGFLKFFVAMLKDYKRYLVYPTNQSSGYRNMIVEERFRFEQFLKDQPSDWYILLKDVIYTQTFSQFVDDRVLFEKLDKDVIFFDESIDAKLNRYTFRWSNIDTPFLLYNQDQHIKTYVPPSPSTALLPNNITYSYGRFPNLDISLYVPNRGLAASFAGTADRLMSILSKVRLKRKHGSHLSASTAPHENIHTLSGASCIYSSYLVAVCQFISYSIDQLRGTKQRYYIPSTKQILDEYCNLYDSSHGGMNEFSVTSRGRSGSVYSYYVHPTNLSPTTKLTPNISTVPQPIATLNSSHHHHHSSGTTSHGLNSKGHNAPAHLVTLLYAKEVVNAARLALQVVFEVFNSLINIDYLPDEIVYRCISEACADLKESDRLIDLVVFMDEEGFVPDHHIRHALIRSLTYQQELPLPNSELDFNERNDEEIIDSTIALALALQSHPPPSLRSNPLSVPTITNSNAIVRKSLVSPTEIWTFSNWTSLRRTASSVINRLQVPPQVGGAPRFSEITENRIATMFFGSSSSNGIPSHPNPPNSYANSSIDSQSTNNQKQQPKEQVLSPTPRLQQRTSYGGLIPTQKDRWSANILEGAIPVLFWNKTEQRSFLYTANKINVSSSDNAANSSDQRDRSGLTFSSKKRSRSFAASKRLFRLVALGEEWLLKVVPNVSIDLTQSSGMVCTSSTCPIQRPLTLQEIYQGWIEGSAGDNNKYTTHCIYCQHEFIPRFCIQHMSEEEEEGQNKEQNDNVSERADSAKARLRQQHSHTRKLSDGSEERNSCSISSGSEDTICNLNIGEVISNAISDNIHAKKSSVWCELLSPWTLHKEMLTVIFEEGIAPLLSQHFKSRTHQSEVIFWNAVLSFRYRGLPIAFLLTNKSITQAFPYPNRAPSSIIDDPS